MGIYNIHSALLNRVFELGPFKFKVDLFFCLLVFIFTIFVIVVSPPKKNNNRQCALLLRFLFALLDALITGFDDR